MTLDLPPIANVHDPALAERIQHRIDRKTKPLGALGRLEQIALQVGLIQQTEAPHWDAPQLVVFAADHGLVAHGVSAYPSDVTWQMVENFISGGAAVSVLARQHGIALTVVDAGVKHEFGDRPGLLNRKVAPGTADALNGPAMSLTQCQQAIDTGREVVRGLPGNAVLLGEMGIGNTSSAALLLSQLTGEDIAQCVGRGTGLDDAGLGRKIEVLRQVQQRHHEAVTPLHALAAMGGFEIAMLAGAALQAAHERRTVVVDGFIAGAAVLVAARLVPELLGYCVWAHYSAESGHMLMLRHLGALPMLDLGMRLGEGSGAALAWPLLVSALAVLNEMASFESAGVSDRAPS